MPRTTIELAPDHGPIQSGQAGELSCVLINTSSGPLRRIAVRWHLHPALVSTGAHRTTFSSVPAGGSKTFRISVKPKEAGDFPIRFDLAGAVAGDGTFEEQHTIAMNVRDAAPPARGESATPPMIVRNTAPRASMDLATTLGPPPAAARAGEARHDSLAASEKTTIEALPDPVVAAASPARDVGRSDGGVGVMGLGPGDVIAEQFRVEGKLGQGGMGCVYRAFDLIAKEDCAIKVMLPSRMSNARTVARFTREALVARELRHPNIVKTYNIGEYRGTRFISMEYVPGKSLRACLGLHHKQEIPIPVSFAMEVCRQLCDALAYAHRTMVHRDLKPENLLLVDREGEVPLLKVTDFGLAKAAGLEVLTQTGTGMGTPYYMAPEQEAEASRADHRSDLYSLGAILYEMLAGFRPRMFKPIDSLRQDVSPAAAELIGRCLQDDPKDRPDSASEVAEALFSP